MTINGNEPAIESFLLTLFQSLYHVDVSPCEVLSEEQNGVILTVSGHCGTAEIGYSWTRIKDIGDSSNILVQVTTYGLPGVEIRWSFSLWKSGYEYRFHHDWLRAAFSDIRVQEQFTRSWLKTFGIEPHFQKD